ncbi:hypothetical protein, partial [Achromobacter sp. JD-1]|uniref:hypothetical protein n=1 Tax=Achromobacter sp. JD-1 TaxID=3128540 RepID=UPI00406C12C8
AQWGVVIKKSVLRLGSGRHRDIQQIQGLICPISCVVDDLILPNDVLVQGFGAVFGLDQALVVDDFGTQIYALIADCKRARARGVFPCDQFVHFVLRLIAKRAMQRGRLLFAPWAFFLVFVHLAQGRRQRVARSERSEI